MAAGIEGDGVRDGAPGRRRIPVVASHPCVGVDCQSGAEAVFKLLQRPFGFK